MSEVATTCAWGRPLVRFGIAPAKLGLVDLLHDVKHQVDLAGPGRAPRASD